MGIPWGQVMHAHVRSTPCGCVWETLSTDHLKLINVKYQQKKTLSSFALQTGKSVDAIHKAISRVRRSLRACIDKQLSDQ